MGFFDKGAGEFERQGAATYAATDKIAEGPLSEKEEKVLNVIDGSSWPQTVRQISKATNLEMSVVSIIVENLERKYLIKQTN